MARAEQLLQPKLRHLRLERLRQCQQAVGVGMRHVRLGCCRWRVDGWRRQAGGAVQRGVGRGCRRKEQAGHTVPCLSSLVGSNQLLCLSGMVTVLAGMQAAIPFPPVLLSKELLRPARPPLPPHAPVASPLPPCAANFSRARLAHPRPPLPPGIVPRTPSWLPPLRHAARPPPRRPAAAPPPRRPPAPPQPLGPQAPRAAWPACGGGWGGGWGGRRARGRRREQRTHMCSAPGRHAYAWAIVAACGDGEGHRRANAVHALGHTALLHAARAARGLPQAHACGAGGGVPDLRHTFI